MDRIDRFTKTEKLSEIYSDFLVNFNSHPNTGNLMKKIDVEAVKRAIRNLLLTDKGERMFNAKFGSNIRKILFEQADTFSKDQLKSFIEEAITNYEKRAQLEKVVVAVGNDEITYIVDVYFKVINNQTVYNLQIKLDRVR